MRSLYKDATSQIIYLYMNDSDNTALTGLTVAVTISKNGSSFAAGAGSVTELSNGLYKYTTGTNDLNTYGPIVIRATATGAVAFVVEHQVVYNNAYSANSVYFVSDAELTDDMVAQIDASTEDVVGITLGYSAARAAKLDNLDATTSSRMATFTLPTNFAALLINSSGHISQVTLVDTTTTNTDMRGTDGAITALTGVATSTNISDLQTHGDSTWATAEGFSTFDNTTDEVLANIVKVDSDSDVVAKLKANLGAIELLTVAAGATTTSIPTDATNTNVDNYVNRVIVILGGDNQNEVTSITAYDGSGTFTVEELTIAPAESVQVLVI